MLTKAEPASTGSGQPGRWTPAAAAHCSVAQPSMPLGMCTPSMQGVTAPCSLHGSRGQRPGLQACPHEVGLPDAWPWCRVGQAAHPPMGSVLCAASPSGQPAARAGTGKAQKRATQSLRRCGWAAGNVCSLFCIWLPVMLSQMESALHECNSHITAAQGTCVSPIQPHLGPAAGSTDSWACGGLLGSGARQGAWQGTLQPRAAAQPLVPAH